MQFIPELNLLNLAVYYNGTQACNNDSVQYDLSVLFQETTDVLLQHKTSKKIITNKDNGINISFDEKFSGTIHVTDVNGKIIFAETAIARSAGQGNVFFGLESYRGSGNNHTGRRGVCGQAG